MDSYEELKEHTSNGVERLPSLRKAFSDLVESVNSLRATSKHSDLTITNRGRTFSVHKVILCGRSSFFRETLSSEPFKSSLYLDFDLELFSLCIDYMYTGDVDVDTDSAISLRELSRELGIRELTISCSKYLLHENDLNLDICIEVWDDAKSLGDADLEHQSLALILDNFEKLQSSSGFLSLSHDLVATILSHPRLSVQDPDERLTIALDWVREDSASRSTHLVDILRQLPLYQMLDRVVRHVMRVDPVLKTHKEACQIINNAIDNPPLDHCVFMAGVRKYAKDVLQPTDTGIYAMRASLQGECKSISSLPAALHERGRMACCTDAERLFVSGLGESSDEVWALDYKTKKWIALGQLTEPRYQHCMISIDENLYVVGGGPKMGEAIMNVDVEVLEKGNTTWRVACRREGCGCNNTCCCPIEGNEFLIFGAHDEEKKHTLQIYSTDTNSVTHMLGLPDGIRMVYGVAVVDDTVLMMTYTNTYTCPLDSLFKEDAKAIEVKIGTGRQT